MPDIAADLYPACSSLLLQRENKGFQLVDPDPIPSRAGAQTAACVASQAVARHRPLGGAAPQRKRAGKFAVQKFAVRKFPVQSRKIPCSEGISADAEPALDGCATLCR